MNVRLCTMSRFKRKKIVIDKNGIKHGYRSGFESDIINQLEELGIDPKYESVQIPYIIPESKHVYTPDFPIGDKIYIETKGRFVDEDRKKILLIKQQHPEIEIRMIFQRPNLRCNKRYKTTYADWCDKHGIKWAEKRIPLEWINEILEPSEPNTELDSKDN